MLSRIKNIPMPQGFDPITYYNKLTEAYPSAFNYIMLHPEHGLWIGASPELLLQRREKDFMTVSLAGTRKANDQNWTDKEYQEQELVSKHIRKTLQSAKATELREISPKAEIAGEVSHLKSYFHFEASEIKTETLARKLHPTPAVAGLPVKASIDFINRTEKHQRNLYAGIIGRVKNEAEADFFVNLRCMQLHKNILSLYLGGGITSKSELDQEWEETEEKAKTLLKLLSDEGN